MNNASSSQQKILAHKEKMDPINQRYMIVLLNSGEGGKESKKLQYVYKRRKRKKKIQVSVKDGPQKHFLSRKILKKFSC